VPTLTVTNYYTDNGRIIGEKVGTNARTDYLTDALGSVTATVNQSAQVVNTYRYKPYGAQLSKTGTGSDPAFRWVGSLGYRQTGLSQSDVYVRARHYGSAPGRWFQRDPLPRTLLAPYTYTDARPATRVDPSGNGVRKICGQCMPGTHVAPEPVCTSLPLESTCGAACSQWPWVIDDGTPEGFVIQFVKNYSLWFTCGYVMKTQFYSFWEAWKVENGEMSNACPPPTPVQLADFVTLEFRGGCTGLNIRVSEWYWIPGYRLDLDWHCGGFEHTGLPWRTSTPPGLKSRPDGTEMTAAFGWQCCTRPYTQTVVVCDPPPE
jgi:RHS repeat-associated protein